MQAHDQPIAPADRTPQTGGLFPQLGPPGAMSRFFKAHLWRAHRRLVTIIQRCTKSLRDSFGLTTLVRLERILWCAALGRTRHTVRLPPLTWSMDGRTLLRSEERTDTIPIANQPCHSAAPMRSLPGLAPFVERLSTTNAIRSAQGRV